MYYSVKYFVGQQSQQNVKSLIGFTTHNLAMLHDAPFAASSPPMLM